MDIKKLDIKWSILFIILLICINFILFLVNRKTIEKSEETLEQVAKIEKAYEILWDDVQGGDLGIRGYMLNPEEVMLEPLYSGIKLYQVNYNTLHSLLQEQGFDVSLLSDFRAMLEYKFNETLEMRKLVDEGKIDEAMILLKKDSGYELWKLTQKLKPEIDKFENELLIEAQTTLESNKKNALRWQIVLIIISLPFLLSVFFTLIKNKKHRKDLFIQLYNSNKEYLFAENETDDIDKLDDKSVIKKIVDNLKKATDFIQNIANGNYDVSWSGLDKNNSHLNESNLAGELVKMRDQMKRVRDEETKRSWANEGMAKFTNLISHRDDNTEEMLSLFISEIIKYLNANQGAIFTLNDTLEEPVLELKACFAYGKKKYISKTVVPGEGLIGQAYLEKDIIYLTDVPNNYLKITSGLGEALPKNVLIVPMLYNEEVIGVAEIASFKIMKEYEIQFIKKILETVSAYLVSINMNEKTKRLLEESQHQSGLLQSQEEELRQNSEELHAQQEVLQGANEQLNRRIKELEQELTEYRSQKQ